MYARVAELSGWPDDIPYVTPLQVMPQMMAPHPVKVLPPAEKSLAHPATEGHSGVSSLVDSKVAGHGEDSPKKPMEAAGEASLQLANASPRAWEESIDLERRESKVTAAPGARGRRAAGRSGELQGAGVTGTGEPDDCAILTL